MFGEDDKALIAEEVREVGEKEDWLSKSKVRELIHDCINGRKLVADSGVENKVNSMLEDKKIVYEPICDIKHEEVKTVKKLLFGLMVSILLAGLAMGANYLRISEAYEIKAQQAQTIDKEIIKTMMKEALAELQ